MFMMSFRITQGANLLKVPAESELKSVNASGGDLFASFLVPADDDFVAREDWSLDVLYDGSEAHGEYVGTIQDPDDIWHVFRRTI